MSDHCDTDTVRHFYRGCPSVVAVCDELDRLREALSDVRVFAFSGLVGLTVLRCPMAPDQRK